MIKFILISLFLMLNVACSTKTLRYACDDVGGVYSETPDVQVCMKQINYSVDN